MNVNYGAMPQSICLYCVRKLKSSYAFAQQAQEVHNNLWSLLNGEHKSTNCLQEEQIDLQNCLEIKAVEENSRRKNVVELTNAGTSSIQGESNNDVRKQGIEHK